MTASRSVLIIGSGFGGIATAVELRAAGHSDVTILERADDVGGVWRENTYPGAGCDVPSPLYSFSFDSHPGWPRRYAGQRDIHDYLRRVAAERGVLECIRFGVTVTSAAFDDAAGTWTVTAADGRRFTADILVPATGQLSEPVLPDIPGRESFRGNAFHSARWDHDHDLRGKRVAVIGTGASAIQFVPEVQRQARQLTVFQRSAPYLMPKRDHDYSRWPRRALRAPALQTLDRLGFWLYAEFAQQCLGRWHAMIPVFRRQTERHLRRQVADPELRRRLTPDYTLGCKRVLFANDYFPALAEPNVELVTEPIAEITERGVRRADGVEHEADTVIYGTGFAASDPLGTIEVTGLDGRRLADEWRLGARAHLGISVPGFPNMFLMYGPNTNLGGGSVVYMLESQARYIRDAVDTLAARPGWYLHARPEAERAWDDEVQRRLADSVWSRCSSWYRNEHGRIVANWPGTTREYRRRTTALDLADYRVGEAQPVPVAEPSPS